MKKVLFFTGPWCKPCKILLPKVEEIIKKYKDKVLFEVIDCDDENNVITVMENNVTSTPYIVVFNESGVVIFKRSGIFNLSELINILEKINSENEND